MAVGVLMFLLVALVAEGTTTATLAETPARRQHDFRLPGDVRPSNYTLRIITHFQDDDFRFYGQMMVDLDVVQDTKEVRLHAHHLKVDQRSVSLTPLQDQDSNDIPPVNQQEEEEEEEEEEEAGQKQDQEAEMQHEQKPEVQLEQTPEIEQEEQTPEIGQEEQKPEVQQEQKPEVQQEQKPEVEQEQKPEVQQEQKPEILQEQQPEAPQEQQIPDSEQEQNLKIAQELNRKVQPDQKQKTKREQKGSRGRSSHYQHAASDASFRGLSLANVSLDAALEQLVVSLSEPLRAGTRYRLSVRYWGTLSTEDRGYYRGSYVQGNQTRWVSSTVFEPALARRAFPCFDEPELKANFTLILGRHANYSSSANMPLDRTEPMEEAPGWFWDFYPPTPRMSTYLVAFMVHDLEKTDAAAGCALAAHTVHAVHALTSPGRAQQSNFSLWVAPQVLSTLTATLGVPTGLPKHDLVVVPGFKSEALENWGLVSFEERHLLLSPNASQLSKQSVGTVVAHELAHIWFGNLLTPAWWSDIWLSEGFATYYSAEALEKIFPTWRFHETAAGNAFLLITSADASPFSMPVIHPANNPSKLESIFSAISYYKGYWMLRMLQGTLGADVFDRGIRRYVRSHQYSSVTTQDLWDALQAAVEERAELDLQAAASGADVVVVADDADDDDQDFARVVVSDSNATESSRPRGSRLRRDAGKVVLW